MIALYARVSTAEQAREGYSIKEQAERLQAYCKAQAWRDYKLYSDGGYSGGNMERPALQQLISDVKAGKISKVVVFKLDRLSRSQKDTLELIEDVFIACGADFVSMSENFDTGTPLGRAMIGILAVFAQLEREQIKERVSIGREARAKEGKWHGGSTAPVGYTYTDGQLVVDDFEAMQVQEVFRLYLAGYSFVEIAETLNAKGWKHKHGDWLPQRVRYVLKNPLYIGTVTFSGCTYTGSHVPIISDDVFNAAAALLKKNAKTKKAPIHDAYFTGKIYCARCGARYCHATSHTRAGKRISYYICYSKTKNNKSMIKDPNCKNQNYRCDDFDAAIFAELRGLTLADAIAYRRQASGGSPALAALKKELAKADQKISRLLDLYASGSFTVEELNAKVEPLKERRGLLEKQITESEDCKRSDAELQQIISSIGAILDTNDEHAIRALSDALIQKIEIDGDDITIYWNFD